MKFDKILEYQKIDSDLISLENEVAKSKERSLLATAKAKIDSATESIGRLSTEANELLLGYTKLKARIDSLKAKLDEFDGIIDEVDEASEADYYIKQVGGIADEIASLERDAQKDAYHIDEVGENYKRTWDAGMKASENYKQIRGDYDNFVAERQPKVKEINAKLNALKADIPQTLLDIYYAHRQAKKLPAFVEYDAKTSTCKGCYMEVANDTKSKLKNPGDYVECPNCRRILFIAEN
ncbi:MAG: C4-type zinc ribbon domain-containing protein [Clostridia bacterium]